MASRTFSPPRIPFSQSWTTATLILSVWPSMAGAQTIHGSAKCIIDGADYSTMVMKSNDPYALKVTAGLVLAGVLLFGASFNDPFHFDDAHITNDANVTNA